METNTLTLANGDTNAQMTVLTAIPVEDNPLDAKIKETMENWQGQLASDGSVKQDYIPLDDYNKIKLDKVTTFTEWKQIDGRPVKVISFNLFCIVHGKFGTQYKPQWKCNRVSFTEEPPKVEIEIH